MTDLTSFEPEDLFGYERLMQRAMLSVMKAAMQRLSELESMGEHMIYITFMVPHPKNNVSLRLAVQYPEEMTIQFQQDQFWDLSCNSDSFSVRLLFDGTLEKLSIHYESILTFYDPLVPFGMQFRPTLYDEEEEGAIHWDDLMRDSLSSAPKGPVLKIVGSPDEKESTALKHSEGSEQGLSNILTHPEACTKNTLGGDKSSSSSDPSSGDGQHPDDEHPAVSIASALHASPQTQNQSQKSLETPEDTTQKDLEKGIFGGQKNRTEEKGGCLSSVGADPENKIIRLDSFFAQKGLDDHA